MRFGKKNIYCILFIIKTFKIIENIVGKSSTGAFFKCIVMVCKRSKRTKKCLITMGTLAFMQFLCV